MDRYFYYVTSSVNNSVALVLSFENGLVSEAINKSIINISCELDEREIHNTGLASMPVRWIHLPPSLVLACLV
jgi:hypothetical protein